MSGDNRYVALGVNPEDVFLVDPRNGAFLSRTRKTPAFVPPIRDIVLGSVAGYGCTLILLFSTITLGAPVVLSFFGDMDQTCRRYMPCDAADYIVHLVGMIVLLAFTFGTYKVVVAVVHRDFQARRQFQRLRDASSLVLGHITESNGREEIEGAATRYYIELTCSYRLPNDQVETIKVNRKRNDLNGLLPDLNTTVIVFLLPSPIKYGLEYRQAFLL
jgi:hypothetical protein